MKSHLFFIRNSLIGYNYLIKLVCLFIPLQHAYTNTERPDEHFYTGMETQIWYVDFILSTILFICAFLSKNNKSAIKIVISLLTPFFAAIWFWLFTLERIMGSHSFIRTAEPGFYVFLVNSVLGLLLIFHIIFRKESPRTGTVTPVILRIPMVICYLLLISVFFVPVFSGLQNYRGSHNPVTIYGSDYLPFLFYFVFLSLIGAVVAGIRHLENTRFLFLYVLVLLSGVFYFCELLRATPHLTRDPENMDTGAYLIIVAGSLFIVCSAYVVFRYSKKQENLNDTSYSQK